MTQKVVSKGTNSGGQVVHQRTDHRTTVRPLVPFKMIGSELEVCLRDGVEFISMQKQTFLDLIKAWLTSVRFDERWYRSQNADVDQAVACGAITSARAHFVLHGYFEGRHPYEGYCIPEGRISDFFLIPELFYEATALAAINEQAGIWADAIEGYQHAIRILPNVRQARLRLGSLLYRRLRLPDAEKVLGPFRYGDQGDAQASGLLASISEHFELFYEVVRLSSGLKGSLDLLRMARAAYRTGQLRLSATLCRNFAAHDSTTSAGAPEILRFGQRVSDEVVAARRITIQILIERRRRRIATIDFVEITYQLARLGWLRLPARIVGFILRTERPDLQLLGDAAVTKLAVVTRLARGCERELEFWQNLWITGYKSEDVTVSFATSLYNAGKTKEAISALEESNSTAGSPRMVSLLSLAYVRQADYSLAIACCKTAIAKWPRAFWPFERCLSAMFASGMLLLSERRTIQSDVPDATGTRIVPKVIMQFWDKDEHPGDVARNLASWKAMNPDFQHVVFSDSSARSFLNAHYSEQYVKLFDACHHPAMRSDFFRLAYLHIKGGIYVDADELCISAVSGFLEMYAASELYVVCSQPPRVYILNGFIATFPGNPVIKRALEIAAFEINDAVTEGRKIGVWEVTGPGLLSRTVVEHVLSITPDVRDEREALISILDQREYFSLSRFGTMEYQMTTEGNWRE